MPKCVVDASPLIALGLVGRIDLLESMFDAMVVPLGVAEEINAGGNNDPARLWLSGPGSRYVAQSIGVHPAVAGWDLGKGESEVLSWGYSLKDHTVILDDSAARKCAKSLGIQCRGTLGLLIMAKRQGLLDAVSPILNAMETSGIWMHSALIDAVKKSVGE